MAIPYWEPGKEYAPNALVLANETGAVSQTDLTNADFEGGGTGWGLGGSATVDNEGGPFEGALGLTVNVVGGLGNKHTATTTNLDRRSVVPGQTIRAHCQAYTTHKESAAFLGITFYDSGGSLIKTVLGGSTSAIAYTVIDVVAVAPALAVTVSLVCHTKDTVRNPPHKAYYDAISGTTIFKTL